MRYRTAHPLKKCSSWPAIVTSAQRSCTSNHRERTAKKPLGTFTFGDRSRARAHRASLSTSKSYNVQRDWLFEPKVFAELKNAQSIVIAYDGLNPLPPAYCYLKPYYLDPDSTYFDQLAEGHL